MQLKKHKKKIIIVIALMCLLALILVYCFNDSIKGIINILIVSFILSYILIPIREILQSSFKLSKRIASILVISIIVGIFVTCIIIIVPALFNEISNIGNMFDNIGIFLENVVRKFKLYDIPAAQIIYSDILEKGNSIWINFSKNAVDNLMIFSNNIISLAIVPILIYYFLCDGNKIYNKVLLILPTEKRGITKKILNDIDRVLTRYIASQLLLSGLIGLLTFILLLIFKVKFLLWISILNAILNIIPYFGPVFGAIPAIIVALLDSPTKGLWITLGMLVIQQIEGNILSPKITGDSTDMHPMVIIILLLIGDKFGGFIGMILVIPIAVIIKVLYDDINYYLF